MKIEHRKKTKLLMQANEEENKEEVKNENEEDVKNKKKVDSQELNEEKPIS